MVFIDRDGTIIRQVELLHKPSQLKIFAGAAKAVAELNKEGYLVIIVTNQPVVARGIIGPRQVDDIHTVLIDRFAKKGARIDAAYFCPHHPMANVKKYRKVCACRKPSPGMILKAAKDWGVDLGKSFLVGDSTQDVQAGNRARVKTILVKTGHAGKDMWQHAGRPDFIAKNLAATVRFIKNRKRAA